MAVKKKTSSRRKTSKAASASARKRVSFDDKAKIKVVGEHNRREGSRYYEGYETLKKTGTVGAFRSKREKTGDAQELLRAAIKDGFIKVA
jgi:hypothetical protein